MKFKTYKNEHFEMLDWHDVKIHAISFDNEKFELFFDIDFISKWVLRPADNRYEFFIAPATLVFTNTHDLNIDAYNLDFTIDVIERTAIGKPINAAYIKEQTEFVWQIILTTGKITFKSVGFLLFLRREPVLYKDQYFTLTQRGGISFQYEDDNNKLL